MDFNKRINAMRRYKEQSDLLLSIESDRGRIINCAALRRLQQKTQVFPLERNAAVRSRLTHSLEVQQNGRFIAQSIIRKLNPTPRSDTVLSEDIANALVSLVEMACLMHDIGNPAFGHFGEAAINDWFKRFFNSHSKWQLTGLRTSLESQLISDLCHFEGNAQAIRVVTTLANLNLTYSQIASILKYTRCGTSPKNPNGAKSYLAKKVGYYYSEKKIIHDLYDKLELTVGNRHLAAYIMEAADDIAYCLADIEDAVVKSLLSVEHLVQLLQKEYSHQLQKMSLNGGETLISEACEKALKKAKQNPTNLSTEFFIYLRVELIHPLVKHASNRFVENLEHIFEGCFNQALLEDHSHQHAITLTLKQVALKHVFCHPEVEELELQGYKITSGILNEYCRLLDTSEETFQHIIAHNHAYPIEVRLLKRIPGQYISVYRKAISQLSPQQQKDPIYEFYYRCRLLQDFISGMTDQLAYDTYRTLMVTD
ncbi:dGTPase [Pseudoalteromonas luteoviolacea]|uniref:dGTPase n=1 Tax=Pseudoalteromonas luteoviolacea TaxID=43657 RepID=UPI001EEFDCC0|nr:dGTPase [Pseudoalteromonas luteoviolacea]